MSQEISNGEATKEDETIVEKRIGCAHYKRRSKFVVSLSPQALNWEVQEVRLTNLTMPGSKHLS